MVIALTMSNILLEIHDLSMSMQLYIMLSFQEKLNLNISQMKCLLIKSNQFKTNKKIQM